MRGREEGETNYTNLDVYPIIKTVIIIEIIIIVNLNLKS